MKIVVIGQGGHSKVIQDVIRRVSVESDLEIVGFLDDKYAELVTDRRSGGIYTGPVGAAKRLIGLAGGRGQDDLKFIIAVGNNKARKAIAARLGFHAHRYLSLIHGTAVVSPSATIGPGTIVMANAVVNADARVGQHAIVNTGAVVEHDSVVADYVHIAPHATLTGAVRVEEGAFVGAGATVIPGQQIGAWAIVGAGATVIGRIPPQCTVVGTPARVIKVNEDEEERYGLRQAA